MKLARLCLALFAGTALFAFTPAFADDDDDDERKKRRHRNQGKQAAREVHFHHHHHHYHLPSGEVIERSGPAPALHSNPQARLAPPPAAQPGFPKESPGERASAKLRQRDILQKELQVEEDLLAKARRDGAVGDIELHEKNIAALRRELANLER